MKCSPLIIFVSLVCYSCLETTRPENKVRLAISPVSTDTVSQVETYVSSLFGNELPPLNFPKRKLERNAQLLSVYQKAYQDHQDSVEMLMNYARGLEKVGNYQLANQTYQKGGKLFTKSADIFQYKGINEIVMRDFNAAIKDLQMAVLLNRNAPPEMDLYSDERYTEAQKKYFSWYFLGIAYYFNRNYDSAISSFRKCLEIASKDDLFVMPSYWLCMIYYEIGNPIQADLILTEINTKMKIDKSKDYFRGLLLFKGLFNPERLYQFSINNNGKVESPIQIYALSLWYRMNNDPEKGREMINQSISSNLWNDFGYIAGEVESYYEVNNLNR